MTELFAARRRSTTAVTRDFVRADVGTKQRATRVTPTRTLHLPTRDFLETEDERVFDRELASDKKFFELDAKSKSEASDSEGRGRRASGVTSGSGARTSITRTARTVFWRRRGRDQDPIERRRRTIEGV